MAVPILCPSCRKLITSDEPRCPYCGLSRPGARWSRSLYGLLRLDADTLLTNILYLNVGLYVPSLALAPSRALLSPSPISVRSPADGSQLLLG
ncbi:MAG: rhomboid family intramembrane serine protease, partial [Deferrisomatales bacterium]